MANGSTEIQKNVCAKKYVLCKHKQNSHHDDKEITNILNDLGFEVQNVAAVSDNGKSADTCRGSVPSRYLPASML